MIFTLYNTAKVFADEVTDVLNKHEIQNNLLLKNINIALAAGGINSDFIMATVKDDDGKILLTAIRCMPHPMVMYETDNIRNDTVLEFFTDSLIENGKQVDFIFTEKALAKSFCDIYGRKINKSFENNECLVLYILEKVNKLTLPNGNFRNATSTDMHFLPYWVADFVPACNLGGYDINFGIKTAQNLINGGQLYIWEDNMPVSVAASVRQVTDCIFIGQVYTPPHLRGKSYSTACVASLSQKLINEGWKYCALYADCANEYSNKVYRSIGYKESFYYDQYRMVAGK
ncbi:MAG: hypothetical protein CVU97_01235 [Firmicutes bacterium HGW-Firmicutes-21]|nr:MAG: hypothetical protein CVU97_01235 [Firmicutes bacterium HGW-Firmicutes-21]